LVLSGYAPFDVRVPAMVAGRMLLAFVMASNAFASLDKSAASKAGKKRKIKSA